MKNEDFILESVALKSIVHPNIVKLYGACQINNSVHGSRLFMEFASNGDLEKNMKEPFDTFVVHLLQISSAMKYLYQRGIIHFDIKPKNILIRGDGSAVVADFNTAMHVDINTHLRNLRGSENYMAPEIRNGEKYSFSTDVYSFGMIAVEYFSPNAHRIVSEANEKHDHPVLDFISDKRMRSLLEFCTDDDPMCRPSFIFICNFIYNNFIKDTSNASRFEELTQVPRIDEDKINQLRILASRGNNEAITEYGKYLLYENNFPNAIQVYLKGALNEDASCQNTLGFLLNTKMKEGINEDPEVLITKSAEQGDKFGLTNLGYIQYQKGNIEKAIELLEQAYSNGVAYAGYFLGSIYENNNTRGLTYNDRIKKAVKFYHDSAKDGDECAQYKYGLCLEEGLSTDEDGFDCIHYFRQSAYQRYYEGCLKYSEYLDGNRKKYYERLYDFLPKRDLHYLWDSYQFFFDDLMSCHTGMLLHDANSKERIDFLKSEIFDHI